MDYNNLEIELLRIYSYFILQSFIQERNRLILQ